MISLVYNINDNVYKTLGVYRLVKDNKVGIVTVCCCDSNLYNYYRNYAGNIVLLNSVLTNNNHNLICYVCYDTGDLNLNNLQDMPLIVYNNTLFQKRILRDQNKIKQYIKYLYPNSNLNGIKLTDNIIYDMPFFQDINGNILLCWKPTFKKDLGDNYSVQKGIFLYEYSQEMLLLLDISKRHSTSKVYERLAIDFNSGRVSLRCANVINTNIFVDFTATYQNNQWVYQDYNETQIYGYKSGKGKLLEI